MDDTRVYYATTLAYATHVHASRGRYTWLILGSTIVVIYYKIYYVQLLYFIVLQIHRTGIIYLWKVVGCVLTLSISDDYIVLIK